VFPKDQCPSLYSISTLRYCINAVVDPSCRSEIDTGVLGNIIVYHPIEVEAALVSLKRSTYWFWASRAEESFQPCHTLLHISLL
jgi:hypothetical protein